MWIADRLLSNGDASLTCIDPWRSPEVEARFDRNLAACVRRSQITKMKGLSWSVMRTLPFASYDFVYIDGSHEGRHVLEDAVLAFRLLRRHGIIIFDDYLRPNSGQHRASKPAIDAFLGLWQPQIEVLHHEYQVAIRRRNVMGRRTERNEFRSTLRGRIDLIGVVAHYFFSWSTAIECGLRA